MTRTLPVLLAAATILSCAAPAVQAFENMRSTPGRAASYQQAAIVDPAIGREYPTSTRALVSDPTEQAPGTITIDTRNRYLYLSLANGEAIRYDVGV
ncbi:MAG: ErfK/YbiS/YcfS/YnhG family protein, partial [Hyphomicrobiales bacterium]|nr:ErfK/YbiS/YcfS/YnhG family protein [Hyphomicrobiales bacterium]